MFTFNLGLEEWDQYCHTIMEFKNLPTPWHPQYTQCTLHCHEPLKITPTYIKIRPLYEMQYPLPIRILYVKRLIFS